MNTLAQNNFIIAFNDINALLLQNQTLWRLRPFSESVSSWTKQYPAMTNKLLSLSTEAAEKIAQDNNQLTDFFKPYLPETCKQITQFTVDHQSQPSLEPRPTLSNHLAVGVPGRKWQQINHFTHALGEITPPIIEWCSGKAHLGRAIYHLHAQAVIGLEWDASLSHAGNQLSRKHRADVNILHHDVLSDLPTHCTKQSATYIGLHACGQLHIKLLTDAVKHQIGTVAISPCCYHKIYDDIYQPLSTPARQSSLHLDRNALHLTQEETVTAGARVQRLRQQEQSWRLGFELMRREITGETTYHPLPSTGKEIFTHRFEDFCYWAAEQCHLDQQQLKDFDNFERKGQAQRSKVIKLDLVRQLFRQPLEHWLVLDRALYMQENGYEVELSTFCDRTLTPRNTMIKAKRR